MWFKGQKKLINIDDSLAVTSRGIPISAKKSTLGSWWNAMLEKGMAKMNVNYLNLQGGNVVEAFRALTGMPSSVIDLRARGYSDAALWADIVRWDKAKYI